jgi:hypothetical protein
MKSAVSTKKFPNRPKIELMDRVNPAAIYLATPQTAQLFAYFEIFSRFLCVVCVPPAEEP